MFNDIIDTDGRICVNCYWSAKRSSPNNPVSPAGYVYCSIYKKDYLDSHSCNSYRSYKKQGETPRWRFNLNKCSMI